MLTLSLLDQSPVRPDVKPAESLRLTVELAKEADKLGYTRFWVSEHHDSPGLAGSAPEVLIAAIAAQTSRIRVGSGGVLLSHYSPYKVAETFRVLEGLYPGRIDLGIGRAPGGMPIASMALRHGKPGNREEVFRESLDDLAGYLGGGLPEGHRYYGLQATPLIDTQPAVWLLGSSGVSAAMAAELGASFSFAHFINGDGGQDVMRNYMDAYRPGPFGSRPRTSVGISVVCADSDEAAEQLALPIVLAFRLYEKEGIRRPFPTPDEAARYPLDDEDRVRMAEGRKRLVVGGPDKVRAELTALAASYGTDELVVTTPTYDYASRLHSYRLLAGLFLDR